MILDPTLYQHYKEMPAILKIAQDDLRSFLVSHDYTDLADWKWHNDFYGEEVFSGEVEKWFTLPIVRGRSWIAEWQTQLPNLAVATRRLPGLINFTLNALAPQSRIMPHSDYDYDMKSQISKADLAYVTLLCVEIPADNTGMKIGEKTIHPQSGDIIAFDGGTTHESWNLTDQWRYTINIDLSAEHWNI